MLSQGFAFTLLYMTDIQREHLYILFLPLLLNCGAQNQILIHFKHNSVIWNINKYSTDRLLNLQAEPGWFGVSQSFWSVLLCVAR